MTRICGFCGNARPPERLIVGQSGAVICDDCIGLGAVTFMAIRQRQRAEADRAAAGGAAWDAWGGGQPAPVGIPVINVPSKEPRA